MEKEMSCFGSKELKFREKKKQKRKAENAFLVFAKS